MQYGSFRKWGYPKSWMVYNGKPIHMDVLGVPPYGKILFCFQCCWCCLACVRPLKSAARFVHKSAPLAPLMQATSTSFH